MEAHQPDEAGDGGVLPPPKPEEQQYQKGWRWPWFVKWDAWPAVIFCSAVGSIALENSHRLWAIFFFVLPWGVMAYFTRATKVRTDAAGLELVNLRHEEIREEFFDVGAVIYFLRKLSWVVPDFTVTKYRDKLRKLHEQIHTEGGFVTHSSRVLIEARKPQ